MTENTKLNVGFINAMRSILKMIKKDISEIDDVFIERSLTWIRDKADENLKNSVGGFEGTANVSAYWEITQVESKKWKLTNTNPYGAYIEFGVGEVAKNKPHTKAKDSDYQYDVNEHGDKGWTWSREDLGITMYGFRGYEGKSFLYDAFFEYKTDKVYIEIYKELLSEKLNNKKVVV